MKIIFFQPRTHNNICDFLKELSINDDIEIYSYENNAPVSSKKIYYEKLKSFKTFKKEHLNIPNPFFMWKKITSYKIITFKTLGSITTVIGVIICKMKRIKPVIFVQGVYTETKTFKGKLLRFFFKYLVRNSILISATKVGYMESLELTKNSYYLPFCIYCNKGLYLTDKINSNTMLCVSKIERRKNLMPIFEAFNLLVENDSYCKNANLILASREVKDKLYFAELKLFIKEKNLGDRIKIYINVGRLKMNELYAKSAFFILASNDEPAAVSHLEAARYGIPLLINTFNGTFDYFIEGKHCVLLNSIQKEDIYKGMIELRKYNSIEVRKSIHQYVAAKFDPSDSVKKFKLILKNEKKILQ